MITTNVHSLPAPVVAALSYDEYSKGEADISVTGLIEPPQLARLREIHDAEIEEDVAERTWLALGRAVHILFERHAEAPFVTEERLYMPCEGWTVSGQPDLRQGSILTDYKCTSAWGGVFDPQGRWEWHAQINLYAHILRYNGYHVEKAQIVALYRDHDKKKAGDGAYPVIPWGIFDIPLWPIETAELYLTERVLLHQMAREGRYEDCTHEERWPGKGGYARCKGYCPVSRWCLTLAREAGLTILSAGAETQAQEGIEVGSESV